MERTGGLLSHHTWSTSAHPQDRRSPKQDARLRHRKLKDVGTGEIARTPRSRDRESRCDGADVAGSLGVASPAICPGCAWLRLYIFQVDDETSNVGPELSFGDGVREGIEPWNEFWPRCHHTSSLEGSLF